MTSFLERWRGKVHAIATFGDSITQAAHILPASDRWADRLAAMLGAGTLYNHGISGTVMQNSADASGAPRPDNGRSRYERDLLGTERGEIVAILYGGNDARYTAAPQTLNDEGFARDYREVLEGLMAGGYAPEAIVIGSPAHLPDAGFAVGADEGFAGQSRAGFQRYVGIVRGLAAETGVYYAAVNERMAASGGDELILPDQVHPNARGHAVIAEAFAAATRPG